MVAAALVVVLAALAVLPRLAAAQPTNPAFIMSQEGGGCSTPCSPVNLWKSVPAGSVLILYYIAGNGPVGFSAPFAGSTTATVGTSVGGFSGAMILFTNRTTTSVNISMSGPIPIPVWWIVAYFGITGVRATGQSLSATSPGGLASTLEYSTGDFLVGLLQFNFQCASQSANSGYVDVVNNSGGYGGVTTCGAAVSAPANQLGLMHLWVASGTGLSGGLVLELNTASHGGKVDYTKTCVQSNDVTVTATQNVGCVFSAGKTVLVGITFTSNLGPVRKVVSVTDTGGNKYHLINKAFKLIAGPLNASSELWGSVNVAAGGTKVTIGFNATTSFYSAWVGIYSNVNGFGNNATATYGTNPAHNYLTIAAPGSATYWVGYFGTFANCASPPTLISGNSWVAGGGSKQTTVGTCNTNLSQVWITGSAPSSFNQTTNTTNGNIWADIGVALSSSPTASGGGITWNNPPQNTTAGVVVQSTSWLGPFIAVMLMGLLAWSIFEAYRKKFAD